MRNSKPSRCSDLMSNVKPYLNVLAQCNIDSDSSVTSVHIKI